MADPTRTIRRNPAETIELGPRVVYFLSEEEAVSEATRHYESCNEGWDGIDGCEFCYYGPLRDILEFFKYGHDRPTLGTPWHF